MIRCVINVKYVENRRISTPCHRALTDRSPATCRDCAFAYNSGAQFEAFWLGKSVG